MNIKISEKAIAEVTKLAKDAAKNDNWMTPVPEEHYEIEIGDFVSSHREGWEETNHWKHYYDDVISNICDEEENCYGNLAWEDRYYGLYEPLKELFWEVWEAEIKLCEIWFEYQRKNHAN